jgi:hydroxylamine dehydrogenase
MKTLLTFSAILAIIIVSLSFSKIDFTNKIIQTDSVSLSPQTEECIICHASIHPGIVADWSNSLHSKTSPVLSFKKDEINRRISNTELPDTLKEYTVGCYECHALRTDKHADAFEHNGYTINLVVSSADCAVCHSTEKNQFEHNLMSLAYGNLMNNELYKDMMLSINGNYVFHEGELTYSKADEHTEAESCLYCHGTKLEVKEIVLRETDFGEMEFPEIAGWPNNGVGRINTDGSLGSCSACHPRHSFSIETARKPYTCSECHKGPDVPAYKVYEVSKHGNIFFSDSKSYDFNAVPWVIGQDFNVPTCAACHASELIDSEGNMIAKRTHQFNDRLAWRLFGVPYAHPHPIESDLSNIKNSEGLPLISELNGTVVSEFVINKEEQEKRNLAMQKICLSCHGTSWVEGHFSRIDNTVERTNDLTITATNIMIELWKSGYSEGYGMDKNLFDEPAERWWTSIWLFYANSIRMTSAMGGGGDYGVFADGRYQLTNTLQKLMEVYEENTKKKRK